MPIPRNMEKVHVKPRFKSCSKLDIKNYRPIAMLTFLYLVFEKYVYKYVKQLIQNNSAMISMVFALVN